VDRRRRFLAVSLDLVADDEQSSEEAHTDDAVRSTGFNAATPLVSAIETCGIGDLLGDLRSRA